LKLEAVLML